MKILPPDSDPRFLADVMLGRLAKWLRILGFDTAYDNSIDDATLARRCFDEERIALTCDSRLTARRLLRGRHLLIVAADLHGQIHEVLQFLGRPFDPGKVLTLCLTCNIPLVSTGRDSAFRQVPAYVYRTQAEFKRCPSCGKFFWRGTHQKRMLDRILSIARQTPTTSD